MSSKYIYIPDIAPYSCTTVRGSRESHTHFTCFTSTKVQILTRLRQNVPWHKNVATRQYKSENTDTPAAECVWAQECCDWPCTGKASKVSVPSSPTGSSQHVSLQAPAGVCCMLGYSIQGTRCRAGHCTYRCRAGHCTYTLTYSIPALYIYTNIYSDLYIYYYTAYTCTIYIYEHIWWPIYIY
jgi:hypothetical protein